MNAISARSNAKFGAATRALSLPSLFVIGHVLIYAGTIVAVALFQNIDVGTKAFYLLGLIYAGVITVLLLYYVNISAAAESRRLCHLLTFYFSVAFIIKLPVMLYLPYVVSSSSGMNLSPVWIIHNLPDAFGIFLIGYSAFLAGMFFYLVTKQASGVRGNLEGASAHPKPYRMGWLTTAVVLLLIFRWITQHYYSIGIPGGTSVAFPVPELAGLAYIFGHKGLFYLVNLGLLIAMASKRQRLVIMYVIFVVIYVGLGVYASKKNNIIFEPFALLWIYVVNRQWIPKRTARSALIVALLIVAIGVPMYKYMNVYRFSLNSTENAALAIRQATASSAVESNSLVRIYARVVGLDVLEASMRLHGFDIQGNLVTTGVRQQYDRKILGFKQTGSVAYGLTQLGRSYALSGYFGVFIFMMFLGAIYLAVYEGALRYIVKKSVSRSTLSMVMAIMFVAFLMSGSTPFLTAKKFLIVLVIAFVAEKVLKSGGRMSRLDVMAGRL